MHASFAIPLDTTDGFFESPTNQLFQYADSPSLPLPLADFIRDNPDNAPVGKENKTYEPANIRITLLNQTTLDAIEDNVYAPDKVKHSLTTKVSFLYRQKKKKVYSPLYLDEIFSKEKVCLLRCIKSYHRPKRYTRTCEKSHDRT